MRYQGGAATVELQVTSSGPWEEMDVDCVLLDLDGTVWDASETYRKLNPTRTSTTNVARWVNNSESLANALRLQPPYVTQAARSWLNSTRTTGTRVVAVTNLPQAAAEQMTAAAGLKFDSIYGMAPGRQAKPRPHLVTLALRDAQIPPGRAVMVGNALADALAARRAGVRFQWAGWSQSEPPTGVAVAPGWNDIGSDAPEHLGRWLYKIWTDYDGTTPSTFEERADDGGIAVVGWRQRIDEVDEGDPVALWFTGSRVKRPGIYATCEVAAVDLDDSKVHLRILRLHREAPLLELAGAHNLVKARRKQVFWYSPRSAASCSVDDTGAASCANGACHQCPSFHSIPRIDPRHLKKPARLHGLDSYLPAVWIVAKRSRAYYARSQAAVTLSTERFMRLKDGEAGLAQHFGYLLVDQVRRDKPGWLDRNYVVVPVPLNPAKAANGEEHRTLNLARAVADLLPRARVVELLSLTESVGKRQMRRDGATYLAFQQRYARALTANPMPEEITDVVLVDDVCTEGGTLTECAAAIRRASTQAVRVHALTAGQMTVQESVTDWSAILAQQPSSVDSNANPASYVEPDLRPRHARTSLNLPAKLNDCLIIDDSAELFIVEGDSVMATAKVARDSQFQALLPIRGKILNVQNASDREMLGNEECASIIRAISGGSERAFDLEKTRYQKVVIVTSADVDGAHLRCLLITLLSKYMPALIQAGRVYSAMPPMHRIELMKPDGLRAEHIYTYSAEELRRTLETLATKVVAWAEPVHRVKGFGELDAEQLAKTTLDPATRTLRRLTVAGAQAATDTFELLMGHSSLQARRDFIADGALTIDANALDV